MVTVWWVVTIRSFAGSLPSFFSPFSPFSPWPSPAPGAAGVAVAGLGASAVDGGEAMVGRAGFWSGCCADSSGAEANRSTASAFFMGAYMALHFLLGQGH